jgi:hypothetical protein
MPTASVEFLGDEERARRIESSFRELQSRCPPR